MKRSHLKSRTPMKKVSDKRKREGKIYSQLRKKHLEANPYCKVCGIPATDLHHAKRRGKHYLDEKSYVSLCRLHHQRAHDNPTWAKEMGLFH